MFNQSTVYQVDFLKSIFKSKMVNLVMDSSGRYVASGEPTIAVPKAQQISGSPINVAAARTIGEQQSQAALHSAMGGKGGSRRRRKNKRGGAQNYNVVPSNIPTANTVPGQTPTDVHMKLVNVLNAGKAAATYDGLRTASARQVAGFRMRDAESIYPFTGTQVDTKRSRKTKKRHGLRKQRHNRRRTHRVSRHRTRRNHRK